MPYSRAEIVSQYQESAAFAEEHQQNRWGSRASMLNRMQLAMDEMPFPRANSWLDIGCGSGAFQQLVKQRYPGIRSLGIDLSPAMLKHARAKNLDGVEFLECDFSSLPGGRFDLLTCLGVLQKTNMGLDEFFVLACNSMNPDGRLFVSTKNRDWSGFGEQGLQPCDAHEWFREEELFASINKVSGLNVECLGGFLPAENQKVPPSRSHDIYLVIRKSDER